MIKTCQYCGAINGEAPDTCCFCDAPLGERRRTAITHRAPAESEGNLAVEREWRREVSSRLQNYRARRRSDPADRQPDLPFDSSSVASVEVEVSDATMEFPSPLPHEHGPRRHRNERFEIAIPKSEAVPAGVHSYGPSYSLPSIDLPQAPVYPVASLSERRLAAVLDGALLLFSYGGMLALFMVLGGHIGFNRLDLAVAGATFALFYAQYFALFTIFGGSTPGMMLGGLRVVGFEGGMPTSRQMAWRSFGYLISAGTCFLGFLWAVWDEDHLSWQDRISQTYLTRAEQSTRH